MLTVARLKKGTAQSFRLANSARIFINLSLYDISVQYTPQQQQQRQQRQHVFFPGLLVNRGC